MWASCRVRPRACKFDWSLTQEPSRTPPLSQQRCKAAQLRLLFIHRPSAPQQGDVRAVSARALARRGDRCTLLQRHGRGRSSSGRRRDMFDLDVRLGPLPGLCALALVVRAPVATDLRSTAQLSTSNEEDLKLAHANALAFAPKTQATLTCMTLLVCACGSGRMSWAPLCLRMHG
jgi:hypothetical protein